MGDEQLIMGEHLEEIVPPISQDMGRRAVDEPKKGTEVLSVFLPKKEIPEDAYYIGGLWEVEKGVEVMCNIKSPRLSGGSACENHSSLRAKVPWSWSFQLHHYTQTQTHDVKTRSARLQPATGRWLPRKDCWRPRC